MTRASSSWKIFLIRGEFHNLVSWSMSSITFASADKNHCGDWIEKDIGVEIHLSLHIQMSLPPPTLHTSPFCRSYSDIKLLHAKDGPLPNVAYRNVDCGKYFASIVYAASEIGFFKSLQHCLAKRALLKHTKSKKSSWFFETPVCSQLIQRILASFSWFFHQNLTSAH